VGRILDKSGRGNHRTQSTAPSRPTLQQDASGFYYLEYDGVDNWMQTASVDFSATEMTVIAGVHKASDAAVGIVLESSADSNSSAGTFMLLAPPAAASATYAFRGRGSLSAGITAQTAASYPAPASHVLTGTGDIAGDTNILRVNGVVAATNNGDQGTGNYTAQVIYFGRRGGTTLPFNGREYGTIIRGAATDAALIARAERFMASRMGVALA
jgi:hypothetical protein